MGLPRGSVGSVYVVARFFCFLLAALESFPEGGCAAWCEVPPAFGLLEEDFFFRLGLPALLGLPAAGEWAVAPGLWDLVDFGP